MGWFRYNYSTWLKWVEADLILNKLLNSQKIGQNKYEPAIGVILTNVKADML